jgi:Immunity protein 42
MITAGNKDLFAIDAEVLSISKGWIFGRFRFWFFGTQCGDWNDTADLKGCVGWVRQFAVSSIDRSEPLLFDWPKEKLFAFHIYSVYGIEPGFRSWEVLDEVLPEMESAFSKFDISYIGMSAFDCLYMILLEDKNTQRCLWRYHKEDTIHDFRYPAGHMQQIATEFCDHFFRDHGAAMKTSKL